VAQQQLKTQQAGSEENLLGVKEKKRERFAGFSGSIPIPKRKREQALLSTKKKPIITLGPFLSCFYLLATPFIFHRHVDVFV